MTYDLGYDSLSRRALRFALVILLSIGIVALAWSAVHLATRKDDRPVPLNCSSIDNLQTDFDSVYFYMDDKLYCYTDKGVLKWQFALGAGAVLVRVPPPVRSVEHRQNGWSSVLS